MKRILFLKFGALGDVLMTTPLLRQTRFAFPDAEIDFWVAQSFAVALRGNPYLSRVTTFDPEIFTKKRVCALLKLVRKLYDRHYDLAFVLDKHVVFALTAWLARIPHRIGFKRDRLTALFLTQSALYGYLRHDVHCNLDLLNRVALSNYSDAGLDFFGAAPAGQVSARFPELAEPYIVCANSGGKNVRETTDVRRLPDGLFVELVRRLTMQHRVVLLGDRSDREYYASLPLPPGAENLAGKTSIPECATIIANARKMFTTDCGLMHLAATTDTPICALFGPTHPGKKAPLRDQVESLWTDETIYDPEYDRCGRIPRTEYFRSLELRHVLAFEGW